MGSQTSRVPIKLLNILAPYNGTVEDFQRIDASLTDDDKYQLGEVYQLWRLACLNNFLIEDKIETQFNTSNIVSNYNDKMAELSKVSNNESALPSLFALYYSTHDDGYKAKIQSIINNLNDSEYKKSLCLINL